MKAISQGNIDAALNATARMSSFRIADRFKEASRNYRNFLITANTLYRKAAEMGGVHPYLMNATARMSSFRIADRFKEASRNYRNFLITANTLYRKAAEMGGVHPYLIDKVSCALAKKIYRNFLITANTLYRKAAEMGGVHPYLIDKVSCALAKKIETVCTRAEYSHFNREMIRRYCMLVQNYSFQKYTPLVRKAMNYIELNISQGVSLKNLSEELNVNASYLSTVFKKEMGQTVTEYINQRRVEIAILYLNTSSMQIQDIAFRVGICDVNYFSKVFKKITGMTPTKYREKVLSATKM